jgi:hypothetical protein
MSQIKTLVIKRDIVLIAIQFTVLLGVATAAPLINQQTITGPIVNATLFISTVLLGAQNAILVGLVPSLIALAIGLLPAVLAPAVPFIMIGNTILILVFDYFRQKNYWLGITISSFLKFLFLFGTSSIVVNLFLKKEVATEVAAMMSWPQLFTAIAGGLLAYFVLKSIRKTK